MFCPQCVSANDAAAKFCSSCGAAFSPSTQGLPANRQVANAPVEIEEYYAAQIGPKNQDYYLGKFANFDHAGRGGPSWHWPALFVPFYWFLYRKMWRNALLYLFSPYILGVLLGIVGASSGKSGSAILGVGFVLIVLGCRLGAAIFGNALYYAHCKKKIAETMASGHSIERQLGELSGKGGTSGVFLFFLLIGFFIAAIGILAAIAIPAYQDYTTRAHVAEASATGQKATQSITSYYLEHKQMPADLAQAGFTETLPRSVKEIDIDIRNGVVSIVMAGGPVDGKILNLAPSLDNAGHVTWRCMSQEIKDKYLPRECRQQQ
ncbi:MAG: pilin [Collimonas sp.]|uniref:pilin n=1 Tax=Collimonas sp. TaxID=1963772 RepID=UPI003266C983